MDALSARFIGGRILVIIHGQHSCCAAVNDLTHPLYLVPVIRAINFSTDDYDDTMTVSLAFKISSET